MSDYACASRGAIYSVGTWAKQRQWSFVLLSETIKAATGRNISPTDIDGTVMASDGIIYGPDDLRQRAEVDIRSAVFVLWEMKSVDAPMPLGQFCFYKARLQLAPGRTVLVEARIDQRVFDDCRPVELADYSIERFRCIWAISETRCECTQWINPARWDKFHFLLFESANRHDMGYFFQRMQKRSDGEWTQ